MQPVPTDNHVWMEVTPKLCRVESHPASIELGYHSVKINSESHERVSLRRSLAVGWFALFMALVAGCAGSSNTPDTPEAMRSYTIDLTTDDSADEYRYITLDPIDIQVGDEVTFSMVNTGSLPHDLNIIEPSGNQVAGADAVPAGGTLLVTMLFDQPGLYRLNCNVGDHLTLHSMQAFVEVVKPE